MGWRHAFGWHIEGLLGYADQALSLIEDARAFARHLNKRFAVAYAEEIGSWTETLRGDFARVRAAAQAGEQLSSELGFSMLRARAKIMGGYARANLGETDGAIDFIRAALAELDLMQAPFHRLRFIWLHWQKHKPLPALSRTPWSRLNKRCRPILMSCSAAPRRFVSAASCASAARGSSPKPAKGGQTPHGRRRRV